MQKQKQKQKRPTVSSPNTAIQFSDDLQTLTIGILNWALNVNLEFINLMPSHHLLTLTICNFVMSETDSREDISG
jgi:hypothetical protein